MQEYKLRNAKLQSCILALIHRPSERPTLLPITSLLVLQTHMRQSKGIAGCMVRVINLCSGWISPLYGAHSRSPKSDRNSLRGLHFFGRSSHHLFRGLIQIKVAAGTYHRLFSYRPLAFLCRTLMRSITIGKTRTAQALL
jgi:hypothetical protein